MPVPSAERPILPPGTRDGVCDLLLGFARVLDHEQLAASVAADMVLVVTIDGLRDEVLDTADELGAFDA